MRYPAPKPKLINTRRPNAFLLCVAGADFAMQYRFTMLDICHKRSCSAPAGQIFPHQSAGAISASTSRSGSPNAIALVSKVITRQRESPPTEVRKRESGSSQIRMGYPTSAPPAARRTSTLPTRGTLADQPILFFNGERAAATFWQVPAGQIQRQKNRGDSRHTIPMTTPATSANPMAPVKSAIHARKGLSDVTYPSSHGGRANGMAQISAMPRMMTRITCLACFIM